MDICRTCLSNTSNEPVPIFSKLGDQFVANVITDCSSVAIIEDDGLPATICQECIKSVQMIADFAAKVRESDRKLRKLFKSEVPICDVEEGTDGTDALNTSVDHLKFEVEVQSESEALEAELDFEDGNDSDWKDDGQKTSEDEEDGDEVNWNVEADEESSKLRRAKKKPKKAKGDGDDAEEMPEPLNEKEQDFYEPIQIDPARYVCCWCCVDFETKEQLIKHGTNHRNGLWRREKIVRPYYCEICYRCFKRQKNLEDHIKEAAKLSSQTIYQCKRCSARFVAPRRRRLHMFYHDPEDPQVDETASEQKARICCMRLCNKQFETEEELMEHGQQEHIASKQETVDPKHPHECPVCFKRFKTAETVYRHRLRMYKSGTQCSVCGKKFKSKVAMLKHKWLHQEERNWVCEICAKGFPTNQKLIDHMVVHTDVCTDGTDAFNTSLDHLKFEVDIGKVEVQSDSEALETGLDFEDGNDSDWKDEGQKMSEDEDDGDDVNRNVGRKAKMKQEADEESPKRQRAKKKPKKAKDDGDDGEEVPEPLNEKEQEFFEPIQIDPARFICCWCCVDYETKEQLIKHGTNHRNGLWRREKLFRPYYCEICYRCFKRQKNLEDHIKNAAKLSSQTIYQCKRCPARFVAARRRRLHMFYHKPEDAHADKTENEQKAKFCCIRSCNKQFETEEEILEHGQQEHIALKQETVDPKYPHECPVCFKRFKYAETVNRHRLRIYQCDTQCSVCGKEFKSKHAMLRHEWLHQDVRNCVCEICGKAFPTKQELKEHTVVHTDERPFVCKVCGWRYKRKSNLMKHSVIHSTPFKCEVCDKSFKVR